MTAYVWPPPRRTLFSRSAHPPPDRSSDADAAYLAIEDDIADGSAVEDVVIERPGRGGIVLDFDADGRLLGVEVIGATGLLRPTAVAAATRM